jgi:membrane-bound lytic murein transglycosylase D
MPSSWRSTGRAKALGTLWLGLLITGCAATHRPGPQAAPNVSRSPLPSPRSAPAAQHSTPAATDAGAAAASTPSGPAVRKHYTPHQWPDPSQGLWARIRASFKLKSHSERYDVRVWTQYYATHRDHLQAALRRAKPFLWHVVKQIEARGLPGELALLPIVESGYDPSALSYAGASGLWQFMPKTADRMSLSRDWWYDGRDDVIASTKAALSYLQMLNQHYNGDWLLALAAYNAGPGRVDGAIAQARAQGIKPSYWHLDLPAETEAYVPQLLALRRTLMTPARFGIDWPQLSNKQRTKLVKLPGQTELAVAAKMLGMSSAALRRLNPGMRRWASAPNGHAELLIPAAKAAAFKKKLASIDPSHLVRRRTHIVQSGDVLGRLAQTYGVSVAALRQANHLPSDQIIVGQKLTIPHAGYHEPPAEPTQTYMVQSGDTLWNIARRYNVRVASLERANTGAGPILHPGRKLTIPGAAKPAAPTTHVVARGDSLWSIAHKNHVSVADLRRWNRMAKDAKLTPGTTIALDGPAPLPDYYMVEAGDSLWSIANRFSMQVATLRSLNDLSSGSTIRPGERLQLQPSVSS